MEFLERSEAGVPLMKVRITFGAVGRERQRNLWVAALGDQRQKRRVGHQEAGPAVVYDELDFRGRKTPVHRHEDRAKLACGQSQKDAFGGVLRKRGDAVTRADPERFQSL